MRKIYYQCERGAGCTRVHAEDTHTGGEENERGGWRIRKEGIKGEKKDKQEGWNKEGKEIEN